MTRDLVAAGVTQATARAKGDSESALAITFDRAILKNGEEVPLNTPFDPANGSIVKIGVGLRGIASGTR